jgi:CRISPR-associated protein Cmr6
MNPRVPVAFAGKALPLAHKGLLLDKFIPVKSGDASASYYDPLYAIAQLDSAFPAYRLAYERWSTVATSLPLAVRLKGRVRGRLALGLGGKSTTEIGCRLQQTYGVPVIPGSSLKGALRAAVSPKSSSQVWQERAAFLFGSQESRGFATVSDAWWVPEAGRSGLSVDVITAHHPSYYTGSGGSAPTDFDSPVPNHFLTITGQFAFFVQAPNESWKKFLDQALRQLGEDRGLGAKRSSGYGRLEQFTEW